MPQIGQPATEPAETAGSFHADSYFASGQTTVELLGSLRMIQASLSVLTGLGVRKCDLLKRWVKVTTYNKHARLSYFPSVGRFLRNQCTQV
jgi:hypothetical protein